MVVARRILGGARERAHHAIDAVQLLHRLRPLRAGVVGDLVVAQVVRVDDGRTPAHLADDEIDDHVAQDGCGAGLQEGEGHAPGDARLDIADSLPPGLEVLDDDRGHELGDPASQVVRVVQEHAEGLHLQSLALLAQLAVCGDGTRGSTRHEVADAGAPVTQQVPLVRCPALDLEGVVGMVADHEVVAFLLPPAERGDARLDAVEDAHLAGAGHRRCQRLVLAQAVRAVAEPVIEERHVAGAQGVAQDGLSEPVDLEDDEARAWPVVDIAAHPCHALHRVTEEGLVLVEPDDAHEDGIDRGDEDRGDEGDDESIDLDAWHEPRRPAGSGP